MKTAILGGTFNPIHNGHLYLAQAVLSHTDYQSILFIPVNAPSHKDFSGNVSVFDRLEMVSLALLEQRNPAFKLDSCEVDRGGISYTYDTLCYLLSEGRVGLDTGIIIGDDLLSGLPIWKSWDELKKLVTFFVARRNSNNSYLPEAGITVDGKCLFLDNAVLDISSSAIRAAIKNSLPWEHMVPASVADYIKDHELYRT